MTMVDLARIAHCSQSFLSKVENGSIIPSIPMLMRITTALNVKLSLILGEGHHSLGDQVAG